VTSAQQPEAARIVDNAAFTTFGVPGAITGQGGGTLGQGINAAGAIAGWYAGASGNQGFVRAADGTITPFDAPGGTDTLDTYPEGINVAGTITGYYVSFDNPVFLDHGFVRAANGTFTTFDAPGAGTGDLQGTYPLSISTGGAVTGYYSDANGTYHGFLRRTSGTIASFDPPGSAATTAMSISGIGAVTGYYYTAVDEMYHGFVRAANGTFATFDAPGAGTSGRGTYSLSINTAGTVTGYYSDESGVDHAFVRTDSGTVTTFDAPGAGAAWGTHAVAINAAGIITGWYSDTAAAYRYHGFVRAANGSVTTFEAPGAGMTETEGTVPTSINNQGVIAGYYYDASFTQYGFVLNR
jgi:hypothetical protein